MYDKNRETTLANTILVLVVSMPSRFFAQQLVETFDLPNPPPENKRVDGEAFLITNDDHYNFWTYARTAWAAAGDKTDPKDAWVIPKSAGLLMAAALEWVFWLLFWGRKQLGTTRQKVKFSCMTRT